MRSPRQSALPLRASGWGGWRPGAGRKPGPNPRIRHRSREAFHRRFPCHVTLRVREDVPSLRSVRFVRAFERSLRNGSERRSFRVVHYSLQGNHAHFIVEAVSREALGRGMKSLGARLARCANRVFERSGSVLEDRYHVGVLRSPLQVRRTIAYVLLNARRHAGLAARHTAQLDPASSSRWFDGWKRTEQRAGKGREGVHSGMRRCVALPQTWLLEVGWRRHGLVAPDEVPGGSG